MPIIANGDILGAETIQANPAAFESVKGLMIGRMAIVRPWIFAAWDRPCTVDLRETWLRMYEYICADFTASDALKRIKPFTKYFARNFQFGHTFHTAVSAAHSLAMVRERACAFLESNPSLVDKPWLLGL